MRKEGSGGWVGESDCNKRPLTGGDGRTIIAKKQILLIVLPVSDGTKTFLEQKENQSNREACG